MTREVYVEVCKEVVALVLKAANLARTLGIPNILQPGLVKEIIVADILGHRFIHSKQDADACAIDNPNKKYEYLTCIEGGSGQLDRIFKSPANKREESLKRITRNDKIYLAVFYEEEQTKCKIIYEIESDVLLVETKCKLDRSKNDISHVGFSECWVRKNGNGKVVYQDD